MSAADRRRATAFARCVSRTLREQGVDVLSAADARTHRGIRVTAWTPGIARVAVDVEDMAEGERLTDEVVRVLTNLAWRTGRTGATLVRVYKHGASHDSTDLRTQP